MSPSSSRDSCETTWSNQCRFLCSKTPLTYSISACAAERSFSSIAMKRIKTNYYVIRWQMSDFHPCRFYIYIFYTNSLMLLMPLNLRNKRGCSSPCACKHSNTAQRRTTRRFKSFFLNITFYFKQACKVPKYVFVFFIDFFLPGVMKTGLANILKFFSTSPV